MGKSFHARQKTASFTANKDGRKRQTSSSRRNIHNFRQSSSRKCVQFRCKVCMKNFASEYYLDVHHRKVRCKKTSVTLTSGIEYLILNTEGYEDNWEPLNSPEMISSSNTNTYIRISSHIYVLLYNICVLHK